MPLPFDVKAFKEKYAATIPADDLAKIDELSSGYLRGDDYQRNMNRLKSDYGAKEAELDAHERKLSAWEADHIRLTELKDQLEQRLGVPLDQLARTGDPAILRAPSGDLVSKQAVEALQAELANTRTELQSQKDTVGQFAVGMLNLTAKMPTYVRRYEKLYEGKEFDGPGFVTFLQENNITDPDQGFKLYTLSDENDRVTKQHAKDITAAREEAVREFATKHHIPETGLAGQRVSPLRTVGTSGRISAPTEPALQPPGTPVAAPAAPAFSTSSARLADATAGASDLAARMQNSYFANKDK
jgi:hypothetical protein